MPRVVALGGGAPWRASRAMPLLLSLLLALLFGSGGNPAYAQAPLLHDKQPPACDPDAPSTYTAAVVEFSPAVGVTLENVQERFRQNVQHYVEYAKAAKRQGAEIVVFPECGLVTLEMPVLPDSTLPVSLPLPPLGSNPCAEDSAFYPEELRALSCAARDAAIYIVVNLPEEEHCSPALSFCPECPGFDLNAVRSGIVACNLNGKRYFNSDIAFDRKGTVVARYRKYNLFGEVGFVPPAEPSLEFFDSDFGPRFGLFTCFDLMFEQPAVALVTDASVTDIVFPTAWFSELPFLTAVQAQASWSWVLDVNFLGSGYNLPEVGSTGSGIYAGRRGKVVATMEREHTNKLLVGKLPNRNSCNFNATASALGCPRLQGKVVLLDRINWDPPPSPPPPEPIPQPCADMLPASGDDVPSLYQCHLQTMIQLKAERQSASDEEAEADANAEAKEEVSDVMAEMVAEAVGEEEERGTEGKEEEGEDMQYELHISRRGDGDSEGEAEEDWEKEREAEDDLRADEEEFKEAVAPAAPATLRQLIHGPRFRRYLQGKKKQEQRVTDPKDLGADERYADYVRRCEEKVQDTKEDAQAAKAIECSEDSSPSNPFGEDEDSTNNWDEMREGATYEEKRPEEQVYEEEIAVKLAYEEGIAEEPVNEEGGAGEPVYEGGGAEEPVYEEERANEPLNEDDELDTYATGIVDELVDESVREDEVPDEEVRGLPDGEEGEMDSGCQCGHDSSEQRREEISEATEAKTKAWLEQQGVGGPSIAREGGYLYLKTEDLSQYVSALLPATGDDMWVVENSSIYLCHGAFCCDFQIAMTMSGRDADGDSDNRDSDIDCGCGTTDSEEQVQELEELVMELAPEELPPSSSPLQTPPTGEAEEEVPAWEVAEAEAPQKEELKDLRYFYRAVVFNGQRTFDGVTDGGLQVCGVITCTGTDMESCGKLHPGEDSAQEATFRYVRISGRFARGHAVPLPSTLDKQLMPLPPDAFSLKATVRRKETDLVMESQKELRFITFGIYNRNFANDPERQPTVG